MRALAIAALLALVAPELAEAQSPKLPRFRTQRFVGGSITVPDAGFPDTGVHVGEATLARTWSAFSTFEDCTESPDASYSTIWLNTDPDSDAGVRIADATIGAVPGYRCNQSTSSGDAGVAIGGALNVVGLGSSLVDRAIALQGSGWYNGAAPSLPAFVAGDHVVIRVIFQHHSTANINGAFFRLYQGASQYFEMGYGATAQVIGATFFAGGSSYVRGGVVTPTMVNGQWYLADVVLRDAVGSALTLRPRMDIYVRGVPTGYSEHGADFSSNISPTAAGLFTTQTGGTPLVGRNIAWWGVAVGTDAAWYNGFEQHLRDCFALGLCPQPETNTSIGCGRTPLCTPGTTCTRTITAAGQTRQYSLTIPATYVNTVPIEALIKKCGCSWTSGSCNTADPDVYAASGNSVIQATLVPINEPEICAAVGYHIDSDGPPLDEADAYDLRAEEMMLGDLKANHCISRTFGVGRSIGGMSTLWTADLIGQGSYSAIANTTGFLPNPGFTVPGQLQGGGDFVPTWNYCRTNDTTVDPASCRLACAHYRGVAADAGGPLPCVRVDGGLVQCAVGATLPDAGVVIDGGVGGIRCQFNESGGVVEHNEVPTGGHNPGEGNAAAIWEFFQTFARPNDGLPN